MEKLIKTLAEFKNHGLKNPEKADLDKNNELSSYEIKRGKAIEDTMGEGPSEDEETVSELNLAEDIIEDLVDAVGSEEDVERAAEEAYNDLKNAYDSNEIEMMDKDGVPENLAMSALVVKLVEQGKLDPKKADAFIGDNADD
tara:strand:- start:24242 stop:24667 length:426 start_codon:yes stop_codon:yes gene_type:complete